MLRGFVKSNFSNRFEINATVHTPQKTVLAPHSPQTSLAPFLGPPVLPAPSAA